MAITFELLILESKFWNKNFKELILNKLNINHQFYEQYFWKYSNFKRNLIL